MAKISGPLFSIEARGSFGPRLTFSKRQSGQQVRFQKAQADTITTSRTLQRDFFTDARVAWGSLTVEQQQDWNNFID